MWCMMNSPLLAGNDLRSMSAETLGILTNKEIIALNQDDGFRQARRLQKEKTVEVWIKPLGKKGKQTAIALMNRSNNTVLYKLTPEMVGLSKKYKVRDLWAHKNLGKMGAEMGFTIPAHGVVVLKVNGATGMFEK